MCMKSELDIVDESSVDKTLFATQTLILIYVSLCYLYLH